jgi:hypothetical protein
MEIIAIAFFNTLSQRNSRPPRLFLRRRRRLYNNVRRLGAINKRGAANFNERRSVLLGIHSKQSLICIHRLRYNAGGN